MHLDVTKPSLTGCSIRVSQLGQGRKFKLNLKLEPMARGNWVVGLQTDFPLPRFYYLYCVSSLFVKV